MKLLILICALALILPKGESKNRNCLLAPDPGRCKAAFKKYYYDYKDKSCKMFIYGGCRGNGNRFATEGQCMKVCGGV